MSRYPFRMYNGGELLLFAAAPWSLYAMRWAANKPPILCFTISLLSAALLFFAKLTGLIVFRYECCWISLIALINQRRLNSSIIAMWSAVCYRCTLFYDVLGCTRPGGSGRTNFPFSWRPIWFSVTGAMFSGISGLDFLGWFFGNPWVRIISDFEGQALDA